VLRINDGTIENAFNLTFPFRVIPSFKLLIAMSLVFNAYRETNVLKLSAVMVSCASTVAPCLLKLSGKCTLSGKILNI
jgi:hypothetical protein